MIPTKNFVDIVAGWKRPYAEIGKELFLSAGTVHVRIKKMIDAGVITGSHIEVDYKSLGYDITAFWAFTLKNRAYTVR